MATYLITGASRGIGLELTRQISDLDDVHVIFAVTRNRSDGLDTLMAAKTKAKIVNIRLPSMSSQNEIDAAVQDVATRLDGKGLDVLINNAGTMPTVPDRKMWNTPAEEIRDCFEVNVIGTNIVTAAFLPLLRKGQQKKVVNISSVMASISRAWDYNWAPAVCNRIRQGFVCVCISPGWIKTDMGTENADLDIEVGVKGLLTKIQESDCSSNGTFNYSGARMGERGIWDSLRWKASGVVDLFRSLHVRLCRRSISSGETSAICHSRMKW